MKNIFLRKVVDLLCTTILLFACDELDHMNLDHEFAKMQEVSSRIEGETFISKDKAIEIADLFFSKLTESNVSTRSDSKVQRTSNSVETISENGNSLMYIMNYLDGGFVIIGATKNYYPVLAYSDKNSFDLSIEIDGLSEWLKETKEAIKTSNALNDTIKTKMQYLWKSFETADVISFREAQDAQLRSSSNIGLEAFWDRWNELQIQYGIEGWNFYSLLQCKQIFEEAGFLEQYESICYGAEYNNSPLDCSIIGIKTGNIATRVGPLLSTEWHQGTPFNDLCNGYSAGCGAIALAQVMNYYKYPQSFSWNGYPFNWSNIPVPPDPNSSQAALVRLVGNAVNMSYHSYGSWATPANMEDGIRFLGYNVTRASHNFYSVESELLTYRRPVIMVGNADNVPLPSPLNYIGKSHYWVCDGAERVVAMQLQYYTEWQPNGNGVFIKGWNSINAPDILGGIVYLYYSMNWGWSNTKNNGWFAYNDVNSGKGNFKHSRQDFYITKP